MSQRLFQLRPVWKRLRSSISGREAEKPLHGRLIVLPGQHGGGAQQGGLLAVQYALHGGPEGHLGLAVAHVAAQQAVHGRGRSMSAFISFMQRS
jgi:hypothetical protein